jgi:hypothetical protein
MKTKTLAASLIGLVVAAAVNAQTAPIEFRVVPAKGNPSGCTNLDASLSRVHTITLMGDKALLKSSGGINDTLKQTSPDIYKTRFSLGGVNLDVVADAGANPRTLQVTEASRGCHWNAVAK